MRPAFLALAALLAASPAFAADGSSFPLTIKDHRFTPDRIAVPAGKKVTLEVTNADETPEEFESKSLKREKVIAAGSTATIVVGPLKPGEYTFVGEFHEDTAKGVLVVE